MDDPEFPPEVKPCPFCGATVAKHQLHLKKTERYPEVQPQEFEGWAYYVFCASCACQGGWAKSEAGAIRVWNMRSVNPG